MYEKHELVDSIEHVIFKAKNVYFLLFSFHKAKDSDDVEFRKLWAEINNPENAEKAVKEFFAGSAAKDLMDLLKDKSKGPKRSGKRKSAK